jgi:hypothetical protein
MNRIFFGTVIGLASSGAKARGGSCNSVLCDATASIFLLLLSGIFAVSMYDSIRKQGFIRGVISNRAARILFVYVGILIIAIGGSVSAHKIWGKVGSISYLALIGISVLTLSKASK